MWQKRKLKDALGVNSNYTQALPHDPLTPKGFSCSGSPGLLPPSQHQGLSTADSDAKAAEYARTQSIMRTSRCVRAAAYSYISPEPMVDPILLAISKGACRMLSLDPDDPDIGLALSGTRIASDLTPCAHNYGGHQFGYYVGQLGDGRCISLGEISVKSKPSEKETATIVATTPAPSINRGNFMINHTLSSHYLTHTHYDLQLKGSGRTPYARPTGDGRASLRACIREFLACEYMDAIGIPTTRALGLIGGSTGVYRDKGLEAGAILGRVAPSWIRFGSFELFWYRGEMELLKQLADYVVTFHFPNLDTQKEFLDVMHRTAKVPTVSIVGNELKPATEEERKEQENSVKGGGGGLIGPYNDENLVSMELNRYAKLFQEVVRRTAYLCAAWQAAGFIHGVLNTDNMSVHGITLDYGPFLFMDTYDPCLCSSSTDSTGRYRFENQPKIVYWNLYKFGRSLVDLVVMDEVDENGTPTNGVDGKDIIERILDSFENVFLDEYTDLMGKKLGILQPLTTDLELLIEPLLQLLCDTDTDYVQFFRALQQLRLTEQEFRTELGGPLVANPFPTDADDHQPLKYKSLQELHQQTLAEISMNRTEGKTPSGGSSLGIDDDLVQAETENAKYTNDKQLSGCFELLLSSMKQAVQDTEHEIEVMSFMQGGGGRGSVGTNRDSIAKGLVGNVSEELEKLQKKKTEEIDVKTLNEESHNGEVDDLMPLVDIMVATDVHNYDASKKKSVRRASVIVMERERRQSVAAGGRGSTGGRMSLTQKTGLRMSAVKFKDPEMPAKDNNEVIEADEDGPLEVSEAFPGEQELRYRWQDWLIKYRERLITEAVWLERPSEQPTDAYIRSMDSKRRSRMRRRNPRFNLRGWILDEVADKAAQLAECQPLDAEITRLRAELQVLADAEARTLAALDADASLDAEVQDLLARLKRGEPLKQKESADDKRRGGAKLSGDGVEVINQAMRILVGDVWGERSDSVAGWDSVFDREAANRWGGKVPKRKDNIVQSPSS